MIGAKARSLERLQRAGFRVPPFFTVAPREEIESVRLAKACASIAIGESDPRFAVRSSSEVEDGADRSFAGMFATFLFVPGSDVAERIEAVRTSGASERAMLYASLKGGSAATVPGVIVQRMIDAEVAGVAFGRDPVDGSDRVVIAAASGIGTHVVDGDCTSHTYRLDRENAIVERSIADAREPALNDVQVAEIADLVRSIGATCGDPQDVEWAIARGVLYVLQARPVTTPPGIIWDNSNISESYGGLVLPLTFSFARHAYAGAYRQFMRALAIPQATIARNGELLENLLGSIAGRMYYNLLNWYRLLALVPGFRLNRKFMESMMGVGEALPPNAVGTIETKQQIRDLYAVVRMIAAIVKHHVTLDADIARFHRHVDGVLKQSPPLDSLRLEELDAEFVRLEERLLNNWEAPLVNDFFAMIYYGVLRQLCAAWCGDRDGAAHNDLLCAEGGMISAEPARRVRELAALARADRQFSRVLGDGTHDEIERAIVRHPAFAAAYNDYLHCFGDRCQSELKLESRTLRDDPLPLLRAIARMAIASPPANERSAGAQASRLSGQRHVDAALRGKPLRAAIFRFVLARARSRIRDRENLRFERTRVFARVRRIFVAVGERLAAEGYLDEPRDVFYLELEDIRKAVAGPELRASLSALARARKAEYQRYTAMPVPPDRFTAIGCHPPQSLPAASVSCDETERRGTGCCPGVVRGRVRVVTDPHTPLEPGEILVAERTDPGWVVLFPAAAGILVERGSVLSHAAIVSREMGIPSVVAIPELTRWLRDGDLVEFDGRAGVVRRLAGTPVP